MFALKDKSARLAPAQDRGCVRISLVLPIDARCPDTPPPEGQRLSEVMDFHRIEVFAERHADRLPRRLCYRGVDVGPLCGKAAMSIGSRNRVHESIFGVPGGCLHLVRSYDVITTEILDLVRVLEDIQRGELQGGFFDTSFAHWAQPHLDLKPDDFGWSTHHSLVYLPDSFAEPDFQQIQRVVFARDLEGDPEFAQVLRPGDMNRQPGKGCAVGRFTTLMWGQEDYIENISLVSALQVTSSAQSCDRVQNEVHKAMSEVRDEFRWARVEPTGSCNDDPDDVEGKSDEQEVRKALRKQIHRASRLEFDLAFGVEANINLVALLPSARPASLHAAMFEANDIDQRSESAGKLLGRMRSLLESEIAELELVAARTLARRQQKLDRLSTIGSAVLIPLTLLLAWFGVNVAEVDPERSIVSVASATAVVVAVSLGIAIALLIKRCDRRDRS